MVHLQHLFLNEFGPGIWGRDVTKNLLWATTPPPIVGRFIPI